jgi:programmed cell death protein 5
MNEEMSLEELERIEEIKKIILKKILTKDAFERLSRIRLVKPELASQLELYLVQLYQAGKLKESISDEQLKTILETLTSGKTFKIIK